MYENTLDMKQASLGSSVLYRSTIDTPLGEMLAIVSDRHLHYLAFLDSKGSVSMLKKLLSGRQCIVNNHPVIDSIRCELLGYFAGDLKVFKTPWQVMGTPFQQRAWQALAEIPYGATRSYAQQAEAMGKPKAFRAVALANAANWLTLLLPCHRIITSSGELGGYGGGVARKRWLLAHEAAMLNP